jgi:putative oxidoreductase
MADSQTDRLTDIGLLVLRVGFGIGFLWFHGWAKLIGGPETWAGVGEALARYGITFWPEAWGFVAAFAESVCGLLIAVGLFTRFASSLLALTMLVAFLGHALSGQGSPAHSFKNMAVAAGLVFVHPGRYSVDAWLASRKTGESV